MLSRFRVGSRALSLGGGRLTTRRLLGTNHLKELQLKLKPFVRQSVGQTIQLYEEFTGMDKVRMAQDRVVEAHNQFIVAQKKRRELSKAVAEVNSEMADIRSQLLTSTKGEDRRLQLITQEHNLAKTEGRLRDELGSCEVEERDSLNIFSRRLTESHEHERTQAQRMKYWSIIASIGGMVIGILASSINNRHRTKELKMWISESNENSDQLILEMTERLALQLTKLSHQLHEVSARNSSSGGKNLELENRLAHQPRQLDRPITQPMVPANSSTNPPSQDQDVGSGSSGVVYNGLLTVGIIWILSLFFSR